MELIDKANILADAWLYRRDDSELLDFFVYNDIGPALAFSIANGLVLELSQEGEKYILASYTNLLEAYNVEDVEYESLDDILEAL